LKPEWHRLAVEGITRMRRPKDKSVSIFRVFVETWSNNTFEIYSQTTDLAERIEVGHVDISYHTSISTQLDESAFFEDSDSLWCANLKIIHLQIFECESWHLCGVKFVRPSDGQFIAFLPADCPFGVAVVSSELGGFGRTEYGFDQYKEV
jgi:hypothetical protein